MTSLSFSDSLEETAFHAKALARNTTLEASASARSRPRASTNRTRGELPNGPPLVHEGELSEEEVTKYLSDVSRGGQRITVKVMDSARTQMRPLDKLAELHRLVLLKRVWGAQIQYLLKDAEWTDTLVVTQAGTRIVRVRRRHG